MTKDKNAFESWKNNLGETRPWDMLNPEVQKVSIEISEKRYGICKQCPSLVKLTKQCTKCGCFMKLKTQIEAATCPIGKWQGMKDPYILENVLPSGQHKEIRDFALSLWINDKSTYNESFGRHQWAIWDNTHKQEVEGLRKFHQALLPLAREEFESETLVPSWCMISIYEGEQAKLWKHKDDNACTYHINYTVFQKTPWDFYVEGERFSAKENDAVISYGNDQEHWREEFPNPESNLVCNAFFFYTEPDHWFFTEGPSHLYNVIRKKDNHQG